MSRYSLCFAALAASTLLAQPAAEFDRGYALSALHATRKQFLDTTAGLSEAQWKWKPAPEVWSVAEIAEHLALIENMVPGLVKQSLAGPAGEVKPKEATAKLDHALVEMTPIRAQKLKAPEPARPTGRFKTQAEAIEAFRTARDRNLAYIRETSDALRTHFADHPAFGPIDCYQWFLFTAGHTERHVNQMKEVMANANFPKN